MGETKIVRCWMPERLYYKWRWEQETGQKMSDKLFKWLYDEEAPNDN